MTIIHSDLKKLVPFDFSYYGVSETTDSTSVTSGNLVVGNTYFIKTVPTGGTPTLPGAPKLQVGVTFVATGDATTWGSTINGEVINITNGSPTIYSFYQGESNTYNIHYSYNSNSDIVGMYYTDSSGQFLDNIKMS